MAIIASIRLTDDLRGKIADTSISIPIGSQSVHLYNNTSDNVYISLTEAGVDIPTQRVALKVGEGTPIEFVLPARFGQHTLFVKAGDNAEPNAYLGYIIV